ncbi:MAG: hypothetical protein HFH48_05225, partial [Lachnospiraceae bacterium]|nr:hypothetical protein [Lachnospiraceae bacterium]
GYTSGRSLYFNIFGQETRDANREVSFVSETLTTTEPGVQYKAEPGQPIGYMGQTQSSHTGYTAQLWKVVTVNGVEQSREIFNKSTYKPSPRIVAVGIASASPDAMNAMNAAIATQDEAAINAAAAQWNDAAIQAAQQEAAAAEAAQQQQQQEEEKRKEEEKKDNEKKDDEKKDDEKKDDDKKEDVPQEDDKEKDAEEGGEE